MLHKLFLSHAVFQLCAGNAEPDLVFPQMELISNTYRQRQPPSYQHGTGEHVSHISHPLPGRSSMSITRTYRRPAQSQHNIGVWYTMPSQTSSAYKIPNLSSDTYHMPTLTRSNENMQMLSSSSSNAANRSSNTPFPPKQSMNMGHFSSYTSSYIPSDQSTMRQSIRSEKRLTINQSESDSHVNMFSDSNTYPTVPNTSHKDYKGTNMPGEQKTIRLYPISAGRNDVKTISSSSADMDRPGTYDYQSLSRDQVDSHVFSAISHHGIQDDDQTRPVISRNKMTHPTISTNMIPHPTINSNMITHQTNMDASHSVHMEMVDFKSAMLTNHQSTGSRTSGTPGPFAPRFQVPKWEISDSEWEEEIKEGFENSGLVPGK
jgi:hypothetical protein